MILFDKLALIDPEFITLKTISRLITKNINTVAVIPLPTSLGTYLVGGEGSK